MRNLKDILTEGFYDSISGNVVIRWFEKIFKSTNGDRYVDKLANLSTDPNMYFTIAYRPDSQSLLVTRLPHRGLVKKSWIIRKEDLLEMCDVVKLIDDPDLIWFHITHFKGSYLDITIVQRRTSSRVSNVVKRIRFEFIMETGGFLRLINEVEDSINEGFYKNVGSDINSTIEEWWGTKEHPFPDWYSKVYVYPDDDERYYGLKYNFNEKCIYIYDSRHKTDRLSIKIDLIKEWENCFSHLYQDTKDLGERDLQFYLWKEKRDLKDETELWISVKTSGKRPRYVYKLYKGRIPVFKKIDKNQVC